MHGPILALDIGMNLGFAIGAPGCGAPVSGTVRLKRKDQYRAWGYFNIRNWLEQTIFEHRPELIIKERALTLQAAKDRSNSEESVTVTRVLHGYVEEIALRFRTKMAVDVHPNTVRKHFIGVGSLRSDEAKNAVVARARLLKLIPHDCYDHNRSDAVATWDWACSVYGARVHSPDALYMFNEKPTPTGGDDETAERTAETAAAIVR